jgi:hypothetical protein
VPESLKFKRLCRRLGVSPVVAVGTLELLWIATAKNTPRGDIGRFTDEDIAIAVYWDGEPAVLITALVETGWLDQHQEHRLVVHDWHEHAPRYIHAWLKSKKTTFANLGATTGGTIEASIDATTGGTIGGTVEGCIPNLNLTKPNLTIESPTETPARSRKNPAAVPVAELPPVPCVGKSAEYAITVDDVAELEAAFPDLPVQAELRKAIAWCHANPERRKTAKGAKRFLFGWMERAQNRSRSPPRKRLPAIGVDDGTIPF